MFLRTILGHCGQCCKSVRESVLWQYWNQIVTSVWWSVYQVFSWMSNIISKNIHFCFIHTLFLNLTCRKCSTFWYRMILWFKKLHMPPSPNVNINMWSLKAKTASLTDWQSSNSSHEVVSNQIISWSTISSLYADQLPHVLFCRALWGWRLRAATTEDTNTMEL